MAIKPNPNDVLIVDDGIVFLWCPGCHLKHVIPLEGTVQWSYNQDPVKPTLRPSVLVYGANPRCHSFVRDGNWEFLSDSTHELSGKTIPMIPYSEWPE